MSKLNSARRISLILAEAMDAWRVVPRLILLTYGWMVWVVTSWYMSIPSANEVRCQADVLNTLLEHGTQIDQARQIACSVVETIGGPTSEQTMFVSIVTGLSSVVIGLYLNTGKSAKWQGGVIDTIRPTNTLAEGNDSRSRDNSGWGGSSGGGFFSRRNRRTQPNGNGRHQSAAANVDDVEEYPIPGDATPLQPDPEDQG